MIFWLVALIVFILIVSVLLLIQFYQILINGFPPFLTTKKKIVDLIITEIKKNNIELGGKIVYELGCGKALFLSGMEKEYKNAKLIGVENSPIPYLISKVRFFLRRSRVILKRENFFKMNLKEADLIYCYLNVRTMASLREKLLAECRPGTIIISCTFLLPKVEAVKIIELEDRKVYFYKI